MKRSENKRKKGSRESSPPAMAAAIPGGKRIPLGNRGFTLIELLMVVALLGILATLAVLNFNKFKDYARNSRCMAEMNGLGVSISAFFADKGVNPDSLTELQVGSVNLVDPWGNAYQYLNIVTGNPALRYKDSALNDLNDDYDLYSMGSDGGTTRKLLPSDTLTKDDIVRGLSGSYLGLGAKF